MTHPPFHDILTLINGICLQFFFREREKNNKDRKRNKKQKQQRTKNTNEKNI